MNEVNIFNERSSIDGVWGLTKVLGVNNTYAYFRQCFNNISFVLKKQFKCWAFHFFGAVTNKKLPSVHCRQGSSKFYRNDQYRRGWTKDMNWIIFPFYKVLKYTLCRRRCYHHDHYRYHHYDGHCYPHRQSRVLIEYLSPGFLDALIQQ